MSTDKRSRIGVIAGMGPLATVDFVSRLIDATPAKQEQDHIPLLIDHNPTLPNRHDSIAGSGPDVGSELAAMAKRLEEGGADFLVMSCNTAHAYTQQIRGAIDIPFVSMIELTVEHLKSQHDGKVIGVLAAEGCLNAALYQTPLQSAGFEVVCPEGRQLEKLMSAIFQVKTGSWEEETRQAIIAVANDLLFSGAETIVTGCTELPLVLNHKSVPTPLVDPTQLLVDYCVREAAAF